MPSSPVDPRLVMCHRTRRRRERPTPRHANTLIGMGVSEGGTAMRLSLSVRIVETPCKTRLFVPFEQLASIARETGYDAICMRASAGGIGTPRQRLLEIRRRVEDLGLRVSMV